ncbi:helicase-associated domain-containing protein, partial [Streptomyces sp. H27-D2]|uniref:helicase-associated domain-containing protein n=1 Tax=Streptomyces sp. H27-D2 TaxID=3046304 RepID=UPI002DBEE209
MDGLDALTQALAQRTPEQLAALLTRHADPLSRQPAPTHLRGLAAALWSYDTLHQLLPHLDRPRLQLLVAAARIGQRSAADNAPSTMPEPGSGTGRGTAGGAEPAHGSAPGAGYQSMVAHRLSFPQLAAPAPVEEVYEALGAGGPGPVREAAAAALRGLYEDALAAPVEDGRIAVPPRIPQLIGARELGPFAPTAPPPTSVPAGPAMVRAETRAAVSGLAATLDRLLAALAAEPAGLRKAGGAAVREVRRLAKAAGTTEPRARLLLDVCMTAGLIALSRDRTGVTALPTGAYDDWLALPSGERLAPVLTAWAGLWAIPTWCAFGETPTALVRGHDRHAPALRHALLASLAGFPEGTGTLVPALPMPDGLPDGQDSSAASDGPGGSDRPDSPATSAASGGPAGSYGLDPALGLPSLQALIRTADWHRPLAVTGRPMTMDRSAHILHEAGYLGVVAHGALTPLGHALLTDLPALRATLRTLLPEPLERARFQADLTAVVSGAPSVRLAELLTAAADRESEGNAVTWRFSPASVRRALDAGHEADALLAELAAVATVGPASREPPPAPSPELLPQPLVYLIKDVARTHGRMRVVGSACCVRSDDEALVRELAAHRGLRALGLRAIAPTVLVSAHSPSDTLKALRTAGYAPALEAESGSTVIERVPDHRSKAPAPPAGKPADALALAERL